jgi:hypothetical protein
MPPRIRPDAPLSLQLKNIIAQIILLYPSCTCQFSSEDGLVVSGTIVSMFDPSEEGFLEVSVTTGTESSIEYLNIRKLAAITVLNADYNSAITYLTQMPGAPLLEGNRSAEILLSVGKIVVIGVNSGNLEQATVVAVSHGIVALESSDDVIFVNTSEIDRIEIIA